MGLLRTFQPLWHALRGRKPFRGRSAGAPLSEQWPVLLEELELPPTTFQDILETESLSPHFHYYPFKRPKKNGGQREIVEPDPKLKLIQRTILQTHLCPADVHSSAVAYRRGKSIANHVWPHVGAELIITADLQDFFPSTSRARIEKWWRGRAEENEARLLTLLTTYRGGLPQGAPTSPALSNCVNYDLDTRLSLRAGMAGATYTQYCDDLVFSWRDMALLPAEFYQGIRALLQEHGYRLHPTKGWNLYGRKDNPEITGLILNQKGKVVLPNRLKKKIKKLKRSDNPADLPRLYGYRAYEAMVTKRPRP